MTQLEPPGPYDDRVDLVVGPYHADALQECRRLGINPRKACGASRVWRHLEGTKGHRVLIVDRFDDASRFEYVVGHLATSEAERVAAPPWPETPTQWLARMMAEAVPFVQAVAHGLPRMPEETRVKARSWIDEYAARSGHRVT